MRDKNNNYLHESNMTQNKNNVKEHEKEQKISKINCIDGCIVQNNMTAIDKKNSLLKTDINI